jgi:hypothetical protein
MEYRPYTFQAPRLIWTIPLALVTAALTGCGDSDDDGSRPLTLTAQACADVTKTFSMAGVRVTSAAHVASSPASGATPALPSHCHIEGIADERTGADGQPYSIKFRMRAPVEQEWSGRFLFSGGGGSNGVVRDALTTSGLAGVPLTRGYAVVTQDSGHDNAVNNIPTRSGTRSFGLEYQARVDNGYRSYDRVATISKELLKSLYGQAPRRSYFAGCSEGGREALMVTQRFPTQFDGVISGSPLLAAPMASLVRPAWITQTYAELARSQGQFDRNGYPFINRSLSDADVAVLAGGITKACDGLDGVVDGMSHDFQACRRVFDPATLICQAGQTSGCLTAPQVAAVKKQMDGIPGDFSWFYDPGIGVNQLRSWWIGPANAVQSSTTMTGQAFKTTYFTPPPPLDLTINNGSEPYRSMLEFDIARETPGIYATTPAFPESIWDIMYATNPEVSRFRDRGGKMMIFHGVSDGAFTLQQTIDYWSKVQQANGSNASSFGRLYAVPGMGHCGGGPSTSQFDMLPALEEWVEQGKAPDSIVGTAPTNTPWPGRTRPLCPYPTVAVYKGQGDIEKAESFSCIAR